MSQAGLNSTFANNLLAILTSGTAFPSPPATVYMQLHTGQPGAAGTANISAGSATRVAAAFGTPSGGTASQSGTAPSWTNGGTSETLAYVSLWSAATGGTFYWSFALTSSQSWVAGNTFTMTSYSLGFSPIAA